MNIAEGSGRSSDTDYSRFVAYGRASCNELEYQLLLARDLGYLETVEFAPLAKEVSELRSMLTSFHRKLTRTHVG